MTGAHSGFLATALICGALATASLACVSPPLLLYAVESGTLIHAKNKASITDLIGVEPEVCEPAGTADELCTWAYRPYPSWTVSGDMTYFLRCSLPIGGSSREPRSCVFTLPAADGQLLRGPEYY